MDINYLDKLREKKDLEIQQLQVDKEKLIAALNIAKRQIQQLQAEETRLRQALSSAINTLEEIRDRGLRVNVLNVRIAKHREALRGEGE